MSFIVVAGFAVVRDRSWNSGKGEGPCVSRRGMTSSSQDVRRIDHDWEIHDAVARRLEMVSWHRSEAGSTKALRRTRRWCAIDQLQTQTVFLGLVIHMDLIAIAYRATSMESIVRQRSKCSDETGPRFCVNDSFHGTTLMFSEQCQRGSRSR